MLSTDDTSMGEHPAPVNDSSLDDAENRGPAWSGSRSDQDLTRLDLAHLFIAHYDSGWPFGNTRGTGEAIKVGL